MKIAFTTLGCPQWDLDVICARAREYAYDGVDFRGLREALDITATPEFTGALSATARKLSDAGLAVSGISSSIAVCDRGRRAENLEEARRTIPVALALGCKHIRIFGGGDLKAAARDELAGAGAECVEAILALDGAVGLSWLFETHDNWVRGADCRLLLDRIAHPAFGALWDMGHTARMGGELPDETAAAVGRRVGYTHIKDAARDPAHPQAMADGWRYVLPGTGQLPLAESIRALKGYGYDGWIVFEHEKRWHPALPEPEEAFPHFARWIRPLI